MDPTYALAQATMAHMSHYREDIDNRTQSDSKSTKSSSYDEFEVSQHEVDEAALMAGYGGEVTEADAERVRKKIDWLMLPMMCGEW